MPTHPTAFISYSWDDEKHKEWVRRLATQLRRNGVDARLDHSHTALGDQLPEFMEREIRENKFVIIVCTPKYKAKSEGRVGEVGYEGDIMTAEVLAKRNHRKFISVLTDFILQDPLSLLGCTVRKSSSSCRAVVSQVLPLD